MTALWVWHGADLTWANHPHRLSGLYAGLVDPLADDAAFDSGIGLGRDGDTLEYRQIARRVALPGVTASTHVLEGSATETADRVRRKGWEADIKLPLLDTDGTVVVLLHGVTWRAELEEKKTDRREGSEFVGRAWPIRLGFRVWGRPEAGGVRLRGRFAMTRADSPDAKNPETMLRVDPDTGKRRRVYQRYTHHVTLRATVLQGPADALRAADDVLQGTVNLGHGKRLPRRHHAFPVRGADVPGFLGITGFDASVDGPGQVDGRYVRGLQTLLERHDADDDDIDVRATVGLDLRGTTNRATTSARLGVTVVTCPGARVVRTEDSGVRRFKVKHDRAGLPQRH
jgi:hypothetical protein